MLTYISIDACQRILRKQFNVHFVLQDTILGPKLKLKEQNEKTCINIYSSSFLWITMSDFNCEKNEKTIMIAYFM